MSRVGNSPIIIPAGVKVAVNGGLVMVEGPKGKLSAKINSPLLAIEIKDGQVLLSRKAEDKLTKSAHGTMRAHIMNMVQGAVAEYVKVLEVQGVGYKAAVAGNKLTLNVGFTHPVEIVLPQGITATVEKATVITVKGANKDALGNICAKIREVKDPDPYKGKGVRFQNEYIRRKAGKTATGTTGGGK